MNRQIKFVTRLSCTDTKLTSFQRQLNLYGFRRITKGCDQGAYFHPKFHRGRKDLLQDIKRITGKSHMKNEQQFRWNHSENDTKKQATSNTKPVSVSITDEKTITPQINNHQSSQRFVEPIISMQPIQSVTPLQVHPAPIPPSIMETTFALHPPIDINPQIGTGNMSKLTKNIGFSKVIRSLDSSQPLGNDSAHMFSSLLPKRENDMKLYNQSEPKSYTDPEAYVGMAKDNFYQKSQYAFALPNRNHNPVVQNEMKSITKDQIITNAGTTEEQKDERVPKVFDSSINDDDLFLNDESERVEFLKLMEGY
jgi:hypothetical protein